MFGASTQTSIAFVVLKPNLTDSFETRVFSCPEHVPEALLWHSSEKFTYQPLQELMDFRLLELLPGERDETLKCSLTHSSLTSHSYYYCGEIRVSRSASCTRRSRHKQKRASGSARARPELNQVSKKELLFCVCRRHTLSTSLPRIPCGSTTIPHLASVCATQAGFLASLLGSLSIGASC